VATTESVHRDRHAHHIHFDFFSKHVLFSGVLSFSILFSIFFPPLH